MNNLLKNHSVKLVHDLMVPTMEDYILKASALADRLTGWASAPLLTPAAGGRDDAPSIDNQGASQMSPPLQATPDCVSPADIPVTVAFERLNVDLQISPTIGQVEMELDKLALAAKMPLHGVQPLVRSLDFPASPRRGVASSCGGAPRLDLASAGGLDVFFRTPPPPVMSAGPDQPRQVQGHRCRVYDMSKVRRSARLAKKPALPAVKKAQINLCRRLGLLEEEHVSVEQVLHDYITTFSGPVPEHIIAALTTLFGLHSDFTTQLDEALLELAGDGLDDLQEEVAAAGQ